MTVCGYSVLGMQPGLGKLTLRDDSLWLIGIRHAARVGKTNIEIMTVCGYSVLGVHPGPGNLTLRR